MSQLMETIVEQRPSIDAARAAELTHLLNRVRQLITRFVVLPGDEYADAVSLWAVHAHAITAAYTTPRLVLKSPELSSGKTTALEVIRTVVPAAVSTSNASVAAIFRLLREEQATLLLDEGDSIFNPRAANQHEDLRALLNSGWQKGSTILRVVGEGKRMKVEKFPSYAAVALAVIGDLPDTIESRAIIVPMRRAAPDELLEPFRTRKVAWEAEELRAQLAQWVAQHGDDLADYEPPMPPGISGRQADAWEALIALGDFAGAGWRQRARTAAVSITGGRVLDEGSTGVQLLGDIKLCLAEDDRLASVRLLERLNALDEAPWGGWHDGRGMTARDLARRLRPFVIHSRPLRPAGGGEPMKGYLAADFDDAWRRYPRSSLATGTTVTRLQPAFPGNPVTGVTDSMDGDGLMLADDRNLLSLLAHAHPDEDDQT